MFQMENLKHIDRKRNRKRNSYHLFLNYLKEKKINVKYEFDKNKDNYLALIEKTFPDANLLTKLDILNKEDILNKQMIEKFNGNLVMEWFPELKGKELGIAMRNFRQLYGEGYRDFILNNDHNTIQFYFVKSFIN